MVQGFWNMNETNNEICFVHCPEMTLYEGFIGCEESLFKSHMAFNPEMKTFITA